MGANASRPQDSAFPSMGIRRPGLSPNTGSAMQTPSKQVQPDINRPGVKFGPGQSTRFG